METLNNIAPRVDKSTPEELGRILDKEIKDELFVIAETIKSAIALDLGTEVIWSAIHLARENANWTVSEVINASYNDWVG